MADRAAASSTFQIGGHQCWDATGFQGAMLPKKRVPMLHLQLESQRPNLPVGVSFLRVTVTCWKPANSEGAIGE